MRQLLCFLLVFLVLAGPACAQGEDAAAYQVTDVPTDVTADTATHARDQAIAEAQRTAFQELLQRFGADTAMADKLTKNDIADLVQGFEVQQEHISAVRYLGTFTVQFRPSSVRALLGQHGVEYTETRGNPVVVLPVVNDNGRLVLWEEPTRWRAAWDSAAHGGVTRIVLPGGDLDDIAVIGAKEAIAGTPDAIKAIAAKYQAGGVAVAVLSIITSGSSSSLKVDVMRYDSDGKPIADPAHFDLPTASDQTTFDSAMAQGVKQSRGQLDTVRQQVAAVPAGPVARLPVTVPIDTLADWAVIERKLRAASGVSKVNVISLRRGNASIEIEFRSDIPALQSALAQQNLMLMQDMSGAWVLQPASTH